MEEHAAEPGSGPVTNHDSDDLSARLQHLEEEAAKLRAQLGQQQVEPEPVPPVGEVEVAVEEEVAPPNLAEQDAIERDLSRIRLSLQRGARDEAERQLVALEKAWPAWPPVIEMRGDILELAGRSKQAMACYRMAIDRGGRGKLLEQKHATLVLKLAQEADPFTFQAATSEVTANAKIATILSVFVPGLGQIVLGQIGKGVTMLVVWLSAWIWCFMIPNGFKNLLESATGRSSDFKAGILLPLFIAIGTHLIAIFDAAVKAKSSDRRKVLRPTPPSDLPFE